MFKEKIRAARKLKGWTQKKLSEKTGIAQTVIARYENGIIPFGKNLDKLCVVLGIPKDSLSSQSQINEIVTAFNEIEFDRRVKKLRRLPPERKKIVNDFIAIILDLQATENTTNQGK